MKYTNTDERYLDLAIRSSFKSDMLYKLGCIFVSGGKIVSQGYNNYRTYSKDGLISKACSCHAEIHALHNYLKKNINKNKVNVYIARQTDRGILCNAKPCIKCCDTLKRYDFIKNIIYTTDESIIKIKLSSFNSCHITSGERAILEKRVVL